MRRSLRTYAIVLSLTAALAGTTTPAHADTWVHIGHGEVGTSAIPDLTPLIGSLTALAPACRPKGSGIVSYNLSWDTYLNTTTGAIAFVWRSGGEAWVTDDCAESVTVNARICDYAAGGMPAVVCGNVGTSTDTTAAGGQYRALTEARAWVDYYAGAYQRGNSLVEVKVWGSYRDRRSHASVPLPCQATYTSIVPTPVGPIATATSSPQPCA